ncbi:hypothetical protein [Frigoribacterium sp. Leaf186]|uniref:hypothetical protein n=1 Tax=Frigoribacterium sp. Leaf186 TaxID=1736293 RepID=UPI000A706382|nr:hypothetical protein [Frigoribacterium sp. Leaf186]
MSTSWRRAGATAATAVPARGATTGLLFASVDGRRLYEGLGWSEVAELGTWRGRGVPG